LALSSTLKIVYDGPTPIILSLLHRLYAFGEESVINSRSCLNCPPIIVEGGFDFIGDY
jgi:hypothetical protein